MSRQMRHLVFLFIVVIAAAQTAIAQSISVELAENTPPVDLAQGPNPGSSDNDNHDNNDYDDTSYNPEMSRWPRRCDCGRCVWRLQLLELCNSYDTLSRDRPSSTASRTPTWTPMRSDRVDQESGPWPAPHYCL